jgi:hypothetical protein
MQGLPFLVVYGAIVAKVLVAAATVAGTYLVWKTRWVSDAEWAQAELTARLKRVVAPMEGRRTVRGTLRECGDRRWVDCAGEQIDLEGEIYVVRGTQMRRAAATGLSVRDGDDVIVSGQLAPRLGEEDVASSYRSAVTGWTMTPAVPRAAIQLFAGQPAAGARSPGWRWLVASALLSYGALYGVLYGTGALALSSVAEQPYVRATDGKLGAFATTSIAAALPWARSEALDVLAHRLDYRFPATPEVTEMKIALARLQDGCQGEAHRLWTEGLFERAYAVAMTCDDRNIAARSLLALGRYEEAARLVAIDDGSIAIAGFAMIGAGRWSDAAELAERVASSAAIAYALRGEPVAKSAVQTRCLADVFRAYGGDRHAAERIHALVQATGSTVCAELEELAAGRADSWIDHLLKQEGKDAAWESPQVSELRYERMGSTAWAAPFAVASRGAIPHRKWMAVYHAYIGDVAAVRQDVLALRSPTPDDNLELALQVNLGEPIGPAGLADPTTLARVTFPDYIMSEFGLTPKQRDALHTSRGVYVPNCQNDEQTGYSDAMSGDGQRLASFIEYCGDMPSTFRRSMLAALPYVVRHREELRAAIRGFHISDRFNGGEPDGSPFQFVRDAVTQRDLMRVSGNTDLAARWQAIVDRHARMLADRDRAIASMLWF